MYKRQIEGCVEVVSDQGPPSDLNCFIDGRDVVLTWENRGKYEKIEVLDQDNVIAVLPGDSNSYRISNLSCRRSYDFQLIAYPSCRGYDPIRSQKCTNLIVGPCCPHDFNCRVDGRDATLTWSLCEEYDFIELWQNGNLTETLPGDAQTFQIEDLPCGEYEFKIVPFCENRSCEATCRVLIEFQPPSGFSACVCSEDICPCSQHSAGNDVLLSWTNQTKYDYIVVSDVSFETPAITEIQAREPGKEQILIRGVEPPGEHIYILSVRCGEDSWDSEPIKVNVPPLGLFIYTGDANNDGSIDVGDSIFLLSYLFRGTPLPSCAKACDTNDDLSLIHI